MGKSGHGQSNKRHKAGRRAGLSAREKHHKSKESVPGGPRAHIKSHQSGRQARQLQAKQQRDNKRAAVLAGKRAAVLGAPKVVAILPLSNLVDVGRLRAAFLASCSGEKSEDNEMGDEGVAALDQAQGQRTIVVGRHKLRMTLLPQVRDRSDPLETLEVARAADVILLGIPAEPMVGTGSAAAVDAEGRDLLSLLRGIGAPTVCGLLQGLGDLPLKGRAGARKKAQDLLHGQVAGEPKLFPLDSSEEGQLILRHLADVRLAGPSWRAHRPYVLVEGMDYQGPAAEGGTGTLLLRGYVRGAAMSANQLVHVPGAGNFQVEAIQGPPDPSPLTARKEAGGMDVDAPGAPGADREPPVIAVPSAGARDSLQLENIPDTTAGEQTWPTEEELMEADKGRKKKRRRPKGMSEYQAAWILDSASEGSGSEFESDDEEEEDGEGDAGMGGAEEEMEAGEIEDDDDEKEEEFEDEEDVPDGEHLRAYKEAQARRDKEREDLEFPDEVDTPVEIEARRRFAKYRGLKSFRSTPWDPKELLPPEYARVFAFENFPRTRRRAMQGPRAAQEDAETAMGGGGHGVAMGSYVQLRLVGVPADAAQAVAVRLGLAEGPTTAPSALFAEGGPAGAPLVVFGLLQHEAKLSVVHFAVSKSPGYDEPLRTKDELLYVTGVRSFMGKGVFSSDAHGADKHKMERFLAPGMHCVASTYGPISYNPLPLLAFKRDPGGGPAQLVMTGSLRSCDPDRVVLKRITLSGYPYKVHKKKAVVRFMFHNPEDVRFYKPLELWTKFGRRGKITEPIGTHGVMKCMFDNVLQQRDTICASLYKRAFPPWPACLAPTLG